MKTYSGYIVAVSMVLLASMAHGQASLPSFPSADEGNFTLDGSGTTVGNGPSIDSGGTTDSSDGVGGLVGINLDNESNAYLLDINALTDAGATKGTFANSTTVPIEGVSITGQGANFKICSGEDADCENRLGKNVSVTAFKESGVVDVGSIGYNGTSGSEIYNTINQAITSKPQGVVSAALASVAPVVASAANSMSTQSLMYADVIDRSYERLEEVLRNDKAPLAQRVYASAVLACTRRRQGTKDPSKANGASMTRADALLACKNDTICTNDQTCTQTTAKSGGDVHKPGDNGANQAAKQAGIAPIDGETRIVAGLIDQFLQDEKGNPTSNEADVKRKRLNDWHIKYAKEFIALFGDIACGLSGGRTQGDAQDSKLGGTLYSCRTIPPSYTYNGMTGIQAFLAFEERNIYQKVLGVMKARCDCSNFTPSFDHKPFDGTKVCASNQSAAVSAVNNSGGTSTSGIGTSSGIPATTAQEGKTNASFWANGSEDFLNVLRDITNTCVSGFFDDEQGEGFFGLTRSSPLLKGGEFAQFTSFVSATTATSSSSTNLTCEALDTNGRLSYDQLFDKGTSPATVPSFAAFFRYYAVRTATRKLSDIANMTISRIRGFGNETFLTLATDIVKAQLGSDFEQGEAEQCLILKDNMTFIGVFKRKLQTTDVARTKPNDVNQPGSFSGS
jgi:hypothetical protein